jgi:RNA polymerase sigma-70 factor (ECF subfamily)
MAGEGGRNFSGSRNSGDDCGELPVRIVPVLQYRAEAEAQARQVPDRAPAQLDQWMERYQDGDPAAPGVLIAALSPALLRFFRSQHATREYADDLLQDTWLRIHRVRHTYRPGEPVLPWVYAIARRTKIDGYRRTRRIASRETPMQRMDLPSSAPRHDGLLDFETLIASLPESQREVITMLKVSGLTLEEVARATSSTVGAVKQRAHRAYERLRRLLQMPAPDDGNGGGR